MTESARPESIVPAPPQVFRQWVKRQALIAVGITVCVIGFFVVRMLMRERSPMRDFDGCRVWVAGAPAAGSYGTPDAVALEPGGRPLDVEATVMPQMVHWEPNGAKQTTWQHVTLMVENSRKLVRRQSISIGTFALLGETRTIDGVVWQEAWRNDRMDARLCGSSTVVSVEGTWRIDGAADTPALLSFDSQGGVTAATDPDSEEPEPWSGTWVARDGVIRIDEEQNSVSRRTTGYPRFVIGRLAPDGRSFAGFETTGAAVTGTRVE